MIIKAWHGKGSGKSFNAVAQVCNASYSFWVLKEEVLEVLKLSCRRQQKRFLCLITSKFFLPLCLSMQRCLALIVLFTSVLSIKGQKWSTCFYQGYNLISLSSHIRPTCLVLDIQGNLKALIHELDNLHKVSFFELPGGQCWSTWNRQDHRSCSFK